MNVNYIPLGELVSLSKGRKAPRVYDSKIAGTKRYIQINDLRCDDKLQFAEDAAGVEVMPEDICIAWDGANAGTIGYGLSGYIGSTIARLRPINADQFFTPYVSRFLQSMFQHLNEGTTGATIPHISKDKLFGLRIPLLPRDEQHRIADILSKADSIRRKRQESIRLAEKFLRSTFLEMFGDPVSNLKGWETKKFADAGTLDRGVSKTRPRNAPELLGGPYPLIQTGDVANSDGYIRSYKSTYSEMGLRQSKMWPAGTLCITIAANIAKTGILTFAACFPDSIVGFTPNKLTTTEYVQYWLGFLQKNLEDNAPESAQKNINLDILRKLNIPIPDIEFQNEFTKRVQSTQDIKSKFVRASVQETQLFESLSQRAFRGEL